MKVIQTHTRSYNQNPWANKQDGETRADSSESIHGEQSQEQSREDLILSINQSHENLHATYEYHYSGHLHQSS
jgi:hypothetical protein